MQAIKAAEKIAKKYSGVLPRSKKNATGMIPIKKSGIL